MRCTFRIGEVKTSITEQRTFPHKLGNEIVFDVYTFFFLHNQFIIDLHAGKVSEDGWPIYLSPFMAPKKTVALK